MKLCIGARGSPLSRAQVKEVVNEISFFHPHMEFEILYFDTWGDRDKQSSLREMDKSDFFTREIDQAVLLGECDVGIHSAKDLPEPLHPELAIYCLTKGVDPRDSLVLRSEYTLDTLPLKARIGASSQRREMQLKQLRPDLETVDIRGTIQERLLLIEEGIVDGIVVAEAALIRLELTDIKRVFLPGPVAPLQGRLAVVGRLTNLDLHCLFSPMHVI